MPQLKSIAQDVKKFFLPSTEKLPEPERAWVLLDVSPLYMGDYILFEAGDSLAQRMAKIFSRRIIDWNYTEQDGQKSPIVYQNIMRMDMDDFRFLQDKLYEVPQPSSELSDAEKKASSSTSPQ